jgi:type I restriction enzyme S subunit
MVGRGFTRINLKQEFINDAFALIPPFPEQTTIAAFLDRKTALIDQAIDIKQKQIELLKERRQILIHKAVTRGLNPYVKMKESGVEWIGEIPEGWKIGALSYLAKIDTGSTPDRSRPNYWNGNIPWVKTGEVRYDVITETEEYISENGLKNSATRLAPKGTILMAMYGQGVTRGRVAVLGVPATYNQACCAILFNARILNTYGYYFFIAAYPHVRDAGNETSQMNLSAGYISKLKIPNPPLDEQNLISEYIKTASQKIATAISLKEQEIEKLKEYKATLINSAVTGKIKVC